ncbi:MAG: aldo/keto reductase [Xanthomonadales bacterium]|nr:aldo/keto reductase [Xanthomonadales bacterium]
MTGEAATPVSRVTLAPGYSISRLVTGCWQLAEGHGGNRQSAEEILRRFVAGVEAGFTTFDCADIYTGVEALLGRLLRQAGMRDRVQVHTKFVPDRAALPSLTPKDVRRGVERSLRRLGVERLDLVQFHWWDYLIPGYLEAFDALGRLREQGMIRHLGLTNFDTDHLSELMDTGVPLVSIQLQYSLLDRRPERAMSQACQAHGIAMLPYGVLAGGILGERFLGAPAPGRENRSLVKYGLVASESGGWKAVQKLLQCLDGIARLHGVDLASVAAAWVLARPGVAAIIVGAGRVERFADHRRMLRLRLLPRDLQEIDSVLTQLRNPPGDVFELERDEAGPHAKIMKTDLNARSTGLEERTS